MKLLLTIVIFMSISCYANDDSTIFQLANIYSDSFAETGNRPSQVPLIIRSTNKIRLIDIPDAVKNAINTKYELATINNSDHLVIKKAGQVIGYILQANQNDLSIEFNTGDGEGLVVNDYLFCNSAGRLIAMRPWYKSYFFEGDHP